MTRMKVTITADGKGDFRKASKGISFAYDEDENKERGNWTGKMDFLLSTIGFAVGLGNVWRFPYKAYENGGASFLIPYVVFLVTCGLPLFFLELSFGQFASLGPISIWRAMPIFKGIGWGMLMVSFLVCIYYNMVIAYTLYYLFASFTSKLPWQDCREEWMRLNISGKPSTCVERDSNYSAILSAKRAWCNDTIDTGDTTSDDYIFNCTATVKTPSLLYWERVVLDISEGMDDGQTDIKWQLVLCLLLAWIVVFLCMCKGVKSSGKVVYFTAIFPYVVLIILCINNALLPGAMKGVEFYIKPDIERLKDSKVWYSAATQIFYSLGVSFGGLMTMSSYNRFHNNVYRDSILVAIINCGTSVFAGFVIFSVIGYMATITGEDISKVVDSGPGLAFVAYPEGISTMPVAPLWAILFFLMLITLGLDSQFAMLETVITALNDEFEISKKHKGGKLILTAVLCIFMFLIGLPQCTRAGVYVMNLFEWYSAGYGLILIAFLEVVAIAWVYDFRRFKDDIQMMVGKGGCINASFYYYWFPCWIVISPAMMMYIFINMCLNFTPITYGSGVKYPAYADGLGFLMVALSLVFLPVCGLVEYCKAHEFLPVIRKVIRPEQRWGPALDQYRTGRYEGTSVDSDKSLTDISKSDGEIYHPDKDGGFPNDAYTLEDRM